MKTEHLVIATLYAIAAVLSWAILRFLIFFEIGLKLESEDSWVLTRVFFSAPGLLVIGCLLVFVFKRAVHKIFGCIFIFEASVWAVLLIQAVRAESA